MQYVCMKLIVAAAVANYYKINTRASAKVNGKRQAESGECKTTGYAVEIEGVA